MKFENLKIGDEFSYETTFKIIYWKVTSDEYRSGNGVYRDITIYTLWRKKIDLDVTRTRISVNRLKVDRDDIGSSIKLTYNKRPFFTTLFKGKGRYEI